MNKTELLAPAGNLEKAKMALLYGADAVYVGGKKFSLRARASNFDIKEIEELCQFAHYLGKKVYITMNIIPRDDDFDGLDDYLKALATCGVDAIIVSSMYIVIKELSALRICLMFVLIRFVRKQLLGSACRSLRLPELFCSCPQP